MCPDAILVGVARWEGCRRSRVGRARWTRQGYTRDSLSTAGAHAIPPQSDRRRPSSAAAPTSYQVTVTRHPLHRNPAGWIDKQSVASRLPMSPPRFSAKAYQPAGLDTVMMDHLEGIGGRGEEKKRGCCRSLDGCIRSACKVGGISWQVSMADWVQWTTKDHGD